MTRWWGPGIALVALALAACSGDGDASADAPFASTTQPRATTTAPTTAAPPAETTTTSPPPPYSFDDSVPPPTLVNTGTDYEAIYRSLEAYQRWLYAHHPDPELIDEIVVPGTRLYGAYEADINRLVASNTRFYNASLEITEFTVATAMPTAVTLHVKYASDRKVIVDETNMVVDEATETDAAIVLLVFDAGRWRAASAEDASSPEIRL